MSRSNSPRISQVFNHNPMLGTYNPYKTTNQVNIHKSRPTPKYEKASNEKMQRSSIPDMQYNPLLGNYDAMKTTYTHHISKKREPSASTRNTSMAEPVSTWTTMAAASYAHPEDTRDRLEATRSSPLPAGRTSKKSGSSSPSPSSTMSGVSTSSVRGSPISRSPPNSNRNTRASAFSKSAGSPVRTPTSRTSSAASTISTYSDVGPY